MCNILPSLTFFVPCYNEEKNVESTIRKALDILPKVAEMYEVIIINDGSTDKTEELAQSIAKNLDEVRVINHPTNKGYGAALKTGFCNAEHDWIFFTDGDLQFDLEQIYDFLPHAEKYHVTIGYRENRAEGGIRKFNADLFKRFANILFGLNVRDIDCAFKLISKEAMGNVVLESDGALISMEFLYKFKKLGYEFKELPVKHYTRKHGNPTGANIKVILKAGREMASLFYKLRLRSRFYLQDSSQK